MAGTDTIFQGMATWSGGTISGAASTTFNNDVVISGPNLKTLVGGRTLNLNGTTTWNGNTANNNNAIRFWNGATINNNGTFNDANAFASFIEHNVGGPHNFNNIGTYNKLSNTVTTVDLGVNFNNTGLLDAQAGTFIFSQGTQGPGTLQLSGGVVDLRANSTTGNLFHNTNAADSLILGTRTVTVSADYNIANFGVGNAFNRRANVSTTGAGNRILAAGDVNQAVSGTGVTNGATTAPTIVVGNVHVGETTYTYNIDNTGSTGPSLRGAIQDAANGGNITDVRLSGNGVLASNWGPVAPGASTSRDITVTINAAGVYASINGQAVSIVNNFENTRSQLLTISSLAGAAAYNLAAAAAVTPDPVNIANQRVGGTTVGALSITNIAPAGSFTEALNASFDALTGATLTNSGAVNLLAAGSSNNSAMTVHLDGSTAGAKTGTAQINFASDGTGSSGLGVTNLNSQTVTINGSFFNTAVGDATPTPVMIASQRVGGSTSEVLTVGNTAAAGLFSEALNASFGANTGSATNNAGSVTDLIAGGSDNAAMSVGIDTTTAGAKSGSVTLDYQSDGTGTNGNSGLAAIAAGSQVIDVSGNVYAPAAAQLNTTAVDFGIVHVGDVVANRNVSVSNAAPVAGLNDVLTGSISGAASPFSNSGTLGTGVAAGDTDAASWQVGLDTSNAGVFNSNASVSFASHNDEMTDVDLGTQSVSLTGQVNNFAQAEFAKTGGQGSFNGAAANYTLDFGTLVAGDAGLSAQLAALNTAVGPADALRGSFDVGTVGVGDNFTLSGFATFADVAAGGSFTGLSISFDSGIIGSIDKVIVLSSAGTNASGFDGTLGDIELRLRGTVVAIPEPGTYLMMIAGLLALVTVTRRRG